MAEVGAVVTNFVATTRDFEKSVARAQNQIKGFGAEASTAASAVASSFGMSSPAIAAFTAFTRQIDRARNAKLALSRAMAAGGAFAAIGLLIGAVAKNFQTLRERIDDVNRAIKDNDVVGMKEISVWREIAESLGLAAKEQMNYTIAARKTIDIRKEMDEQARLVKQLSESGMSPAEIEQRRITEAEVKLQKAIAERSRGTTPYIERLKKDVKNAEQAIESALEKIPGGLEGARKNVSSGIDPLSFWVVEKIPILEKAKKELQKLIAEQPMIPNVAEANIQKEIDLRKNSLDRILKEEQQKRDDARDDARKKEINEIQKNTEKILDERRKESEKIQRQIDEVNERISLAVDLGETDIVDPLKEYKAVLEGLLQDSVWKEISDDIDAAAISAKEFSDIVAGAERVSTEKQLKMRAMADVAGGRSFERPAAIEKGTVADYRAGLANQDALTNTQKNIEQYNKRMADSLKNIESELKVNTIGL